MKHHHTSDRAYAGTECKPVTGVAPIVKGAQGRGLSEDHFTINRTESVQGEL